MSIAPTRRRTYGSAFSRLRTIVLAICTIALASVTARAHPGVGIVQDGRGNVYFTDLKQVWRVAPDGVQSIAVPRVHTHELAIDGSGNLYGEHLWYEGDATKKWGHRVWRLTTAGELNDIIPRTEGFRTGFSFVRDSTGVMYWADRGRDIVIRKRAPGGVATRHASGDLRRVGWMAAAPDGTLYFIDSGDLKRVTTDGRISLVKAKVTGGQRSTAALSEDSYHMGLWTDRVGSVYVAVAAERLVVRVDADGATSVVARSTAPWSPSSGMVDRDDNQWLLEYDDGNTTRARYIGRDGHERVFMGEAP